MNNSTSQILWEEPTDIENRDLLSGIGGSFNAPTHENTFSFVHVPGSHEKVVDDDAGRSWFVITKRDQVRAETAASRLLWAVGYHVDQDYALRQVRINGDGGGEFEFVRFKRRSAAFTLVDSWDWEDNPFKGTSEFDGLRVMMALLTNWDLKEKNNRVVQPTHDPTVNLFYVSALDSTLGKSAVLSANRSRGNPSDYAHQRFIDGVENGVIKFHFDGEAANILEGVTLQNAQFIAALLARLAPAQLSDAFRAGCFDDNEIATYVQALSLRIQQLRNAGN